MSVPKYATNGPALNTNLTIAVDSSPLGIVTAAAFDPFQYASCVFSKTQQPATTLWVSMDGPGEVQCLDGGVWTKGQDTQSVANATATQVHTTTVTPAAGANAAASAAAETQTATLYGLPPVLPPAAWLQAKESQNAMRINSAQTSTASAIKITHLWPTFLLALVL